MEEADVAEVQPGTKLSTLNEVFDFVQCATDEPVLFNIESKVNPVEKNQTRSAAEFVNAMGEIFVARGGDVIDRITHQSFDVGFFTSFLLSFLLPPFFPSFLLFFHCVSFTASIRIRYL